jgi:hypothetical protein
MKNIQNACVLLHVYDQGNTLAVQIIIPAEWESSNRYCLLDFASGDVPQSKIVFDGHADKMQPVREGPYPYLSVVGEFSLAGNPGYSTLERILDQYRASARVHFASNLRLVKTARRYCSVESCEGVPARENGSGTGRRWDVWFTR